MILAGIRFPVCVVAFCAPLPAFAADIPAALTQVHFDYYQIGSGASRQTDQSVGNGSEVLSMVSGFVSDTSRPYLRSTSNPFDVVSTTSTIRSAGGWHGTTSAVLRYSFVVLGADRNLIVPIKYIAKLTASAFAFNEPDNGIYSVGVADANLRIQSAYGGLKSYKSAQCTSSCVATLPDMLVNDSINVGAGTVNYVQLATIATGINKGGGTAFVDPYFYIDPDFLSRNAGLTLQFSALVGNDSPISAVPEVSAWMMMLTGFGLIGGTLRARRTRVRFA